MSDLATLAPNGALPISTRERLRFTPAHYAAAGALKDGAPVYILAALTVTEKRALEHAVFAEFGMFVTPKEIRTMVREGAIAECDPEDAARICAALDSFEMLEAAPNLDESTELLLAQARETITAATVTVSRLHRPLSRLLSLQLQQIYALGAFGVRACLRSWENIAVPCRRKGGLVTEEAMMAVPEADLEELIDRCRILREVPQALEPDSASP